MFLTVDNKIKWRKLQIASVVVATLVVCGVCWFDKPVYMFLRQFNCRLWSVFDLVFAGEVWIIAAGVAFLIFCIKKYAKSGICFKNEKNRVSLRVLLRDFFVKTRGSNAFLIFCSVLVSGGLVKVLKTFIGRARPVFFEALDMTGFFPPSLDWAFNSMPSGHTAISFAGLVMIGMLAPKYKIVTWTLAIMIGVSRIALGAHWPTDVILGAFIGMVVADFVKWRMLSDR